MNIQTILSELNKKMSDTEIGEHIGASQSIVWRLRKGKHRETTYSRAMKIRELAIKHGIDVSEYPTANRPV